MTLHSIPAALAAVASLMFVASPAHAETCAPVEVQNVRPDQGMLMVAAYAKADDYNKAPLARMQLRADRATVKFPLCGLREPAVALALFQDLNGNGRLDTNLLGIPSEPWGASGTPSSFEAPSWQTTQVPADGRVIVIPLPQ